MNLIKILLILLFFQNFLCATEHKRPDCQRDINLYKKQCSKGTKEVEESCLNVAQCVKRVDQAAAQNIYKDICIKSQNDFACLAYAQGLKAKNQEESILILENLCKKGMEVACKFRVVKAVPDEMKNALQERNKGKIEIANQKFIKLCLSNNTGACLEVLKNLANKNQTDQAKPYLEILCENKSYKHCDILGSFLEKNKDLESAYLKFKIACENGFYISCGSMAYIEYKKNNLLQALSHLKTACDYDFKEYCSFLLENKTELIYQCNKLADLTHCQAYFPVK
jgi:hypothetical protein